MALHVESAGRGPAIVCWHGWGMNLHAFDALSERLSKSHQIITVDLPGHGRSDWIEGATSAMMLEQLMATLPERCTLLGWSLGATFALQAATLAPSQINALILLHATPRFTRALDWPCAVAPQVLANFGAALQADPQKTVMDFLELQLRGSHDAIAIRQQLLNALSENGSARSVALAAGLAVLRDTDLRNALAGITQPALVISGQHDRLTPPAACAALATRLPHGQLVELPRAAHAAFMSHVAPVASAITDFLHGGRAQRRG